MRSSAVEVVIVAVALVFTVSCSALAADSDGGDQSAETVPRADQASSAGGDAGDEVLDVPGTTVPVRPDVEIPTSWESETEELHGRYWLYWEAFAAAHGPPNADPSFGPLRELSTEANWASLEQQLRDFAADGLVLVMPRNSMTEHLIRVPNAAVIERVEGAEVTMQDCWIDDFVQQTVDGQVVLETREAKLMNVIMKVEEGQWRVDGVTRATADSDGFEQCETLVSK